MAKNRTLLTFRLPGGASVPLFADHPPEGEPFWPIVSLFPGETAHFWLACPRIVSSFIHYVDQRTVPCWHHLGAQCIACQTRTRRWQGWIAAWTPTSQQIRIVPITSNAARELPDLENPRIDLAGRQLVLTRGRSGRRAKISARWGDARPLQLLADNLVQPADLMSMLLKIWGVAVVGQEGGEE